MKLFRQLLSLAALMLLMACATKPYDYSAFEQSRPKSILVLPPINQTPEVGATAGVLAQVSQPLAEAGYYVFPVAVVTETFRQNGLEQPEDIQQLPADKLLKIFNADAALYIDVTQYGTAFAVLASETRVTAKARLVDLRSGKALWEGSATASSAEQQNNSGGGLAGLLVQAVVNQIIETALDRSYQFAGIASQRLLGGGQPNGILYGPRSPLYQSEKVAKP